MELIDKIKESHGVLLGYGEYHNILNNKKMGF